LILSLFPYTTLFRSQIHALFAGKAKTEDVLKAARAGESDGPELQRRLFYAHLYLGLYSEALGEETQAREHITKAVREYGGADYIDRKSTRLNSSHEW